MTPSFMLVPESEHDDRDIILFFKATLINGFILIVDQMTMCNVKGVTHSDKARITRF